MQISESVQLEWCWAGGISHYKDVAGSRRAQERYQRSIKRMQSKLDLAINWEPAKRSQRAGLNWNVETCKDFHLGASWLLFYQYICKNIVFLWGGLCCSILFFFVCLLIFASYLRFSGCDHTSFLLTPSLPWCHVKTTNKRAKFQTLKPFCFLFSRWYVKEFSSTRIALKIDAIGPENVLFGGVSVCHSARKFYKLWQWRG